MIRILGEDFNLGDLPAEYILTPLKRKILNILNNSTKIYYYSSLNELIFEVNFRANVVLASVQLEKSEFDFKEFRKSRCNELYWERTKNGGFLLKKDTKPWDGINDIFINGSKYATECATAVVIVYYKALLNMLPENIFNKLFFSIFLMDWIYSTNTFSINSNNNPPDYLPGDCRYFDNPDVSPLTPEWQGENAIDLGNGTFWGHGIGIRSPEKIISSLNEHRKIGAAKSAALLSSSSILNTKIIYSLIKNTRLSH